MEEFITILSCNRISERSWNSQHPDMRHICNFKTVLSRVTHECHARAMMRSEDSPWISLPAFLFATGNIDVILNLAESGKWFIGSYGERKSRWGIGGRAGFQTGENLVNSSNHRQMLPIPRRTMLFESWAPPVCLHRRVSALIIKQSKYKAPNIKINQLVGPAIQSSLECTIACTIQNAFLNSILKSNRPSDSEHIE